MFLSHLENVGHRKDFVQKIPPCLRLLALIKLWLSTVIAPSSRKLSVLNSFSLLGLKINQLKLIHSPKRHIWGEQAPRPFTTLLSRPSPVCATDPRPQCPVGCRALQSQCPPGRTGQIWSLLKCLRPFVSLKTNVGPMMQRPTGFPCME